MSIKGDGSIVVDTDAVARLLSKSLGLVGIRVGVSNADYLQHEDATPEPDTRTATGIWWHSHGDDTALIGGFIIEGRAMTITTEGESESPVAESIDVVDRATKAIASQYEGAEILETGLFKFTAPAGEGLARVVVTRDHRVRRPQDVLDPDELEAFGAGSLGFVIVQLIGGEKALVIKHGV
jgi:hypothetical protein